MVVPITAVSLIKYITSCYKPSFSVVSVIVNAQSSSLSVFLFFNFLVFLLTTGAVTPQLHKSLGTQAVLEHVSHLSLAQALTVHEQEGCSCSSGSPQLGLCHQKTTSLPYFKSATPACLSHCDPYISHVSLPMCIAKILCLSKRCNNPPADGGRVSCSAVPRVRLKMPPATLMQI